MSLRSPHKLISILFVAAFAALLPARAFAGLGGDITSVARDGAKMRAAIIVRQAERYAIHEMKSESGATVREFTTPEGKVFAVAWEGPSHPDYQQILGPYFAKLQQATGQRRARRAPLLIETPEFVFQSLGHFRALAGRAYLPQLMPADVSAEEVR